MGLNDTPSGDRVHIGIFGCRNAGKSSIINAITGQDLAIVSEVKGTTTDPVKKAMELLPLGPVMLIDTPGLDDEGDLGHLRMAKAYQALNQTDIAVLVVDSVRGMTEEDHKILERIQKKGIPYVVVMNKADLLEEIPASHKENVIYVSAATAQNIHELKELIATRVVEEKEDYPIITDLLVPGSTVVLVVPVDKSAPKGRLILPQQQTIREILDSNAIAVVVKENMLREALASLPVPPRLVVTDSQVFAEVASIVPRDVKLTSFSILFARHKGELFPLVEGVKTLDHLADGNRILIAEGCTHHRQCEDIGTVKLPKWLESYTGKHLRFDFTSGVEFPLDLSPYRLIIHCGGCTLNRREMQFRIGCAADAGVPMTNYGITISHLNGILPRCLEAFLLSEKKCEK